MNQYEVRQLKKAIYGSVDSLVAELGVDEGDEENDFIIRSIKHQINSQIQEAWANASPSFTEDHLERCRIRLAQEQRSTTELRNRIRLLEDFCEDDREGG